MKSRAHIFVPLWSVAVGASVLTGCGSAPQPSEREAVAVRTCTVVRGERPAAGHEYVGVVEEETAVALSFPVQGSLLSVGVAPGQRVARGETVARLDEQNLRSVHQGTQASLTQAEDAMRRLQQLYDNGSLPEIKYIEAQTRVEQARAMEQVARKNLSDARLQAPFGGVIGAREMEAGEHVMPGQTVCTLLKIGTVKVKIPVPENEIATIGRGRRARITVAALGGRQFEGTVRERGATANPVSHTYEARIPLDNTDGALMPGMVCRVVLEGDSVATARSIVLPTRAVQVDDRGERFVWGVRDGRAVRRTVRIGGLTEGGVVVTEGLDDGERVVTDGGQKISEGMKVEEQTR